MTLGVLLQVPQLQNDGQWPTLSETRYHFRIFLMDSLVMKPGQPFVMAVSPANRVGRSGGRLQQERCARH